MSELLKRERKTLIFTHISHKPTYFKSADWPHVATSLCSIKPVCRVARVALLDSTQRVMRSANSHSRQERASTALLICWRMCNRLITSAISIINSKTEGWRGGVTKMAMSEGDTG